MATPQLQLNIDFQRSHKNASNDANFRQGKWQFNALWSLIFTIYWPKILLRTLPNMSGVISSLFGIFRLLLMALDALKVMKNTRRPDFILVIWTSVALFLESIVINTYIDQSSIWLEHEYKISCLFSLCTTPSSGTLDRIIPFILKFATIVSKYNIITAYYQG